MESRNWNGDESAPAEARTVHTSAARNDFPYQKSEKEITICRELAIHNTFYSSTRNAGPNRDDPSNHCIVLAFDPRMRTKRKKENEKEKPVFEAVE